MIYDDVAMENAQVILQKLGYYPASEGIHAKNTDPFKYVIEIYCKANQIDFVNPENMSFEFKKKH